MYTSFQHVEIIYLPHIYFEYRILIQPNITHADSSLNQPVENPQARIS